jgi:tight adherence protein B
MKYLAQGIGIIVTLGTLFYQSILGCLLLSPLTYFYITRKKVELIKNRKWRLNLEFKDGLLALSAALEAGYSAENAFEEAYKDLSLLYTEDTLVMQELTYLIHQIHINIPVEKALNDFADRTGIEDIVSFAEVFSTAKRTGGDLIKVIKITGNIINDKIEVQREIITLIAAKKLESNIMKSIPLLILSYLLISSSGFLDPLYHNAFGIVIMTIFLIIYLAAYILVDIITTIEV